MHAAMSSLKNCAGKKMRTVLQWRTTKKDQAETFFVSADTWEFCQRLGGDVAEKEILLYDRFCLPKRRHSCVFRGEKDTVAGGYYESGYSVSEKLDSEGVTATVKRELKSGCGKAYCGCGG